MKRFYLMNLMKCPACGYFGFNGTECYDCGYCVRGGY